MYAACLQSLAHIRTLMPAVVCTLWILCGLIVQQQQQQQHGGLAGWSSRHLSQFGFFCCFHNSVPLQTADHYRSRTNCCSRTWSYGRDSLLEICRFDLHYEESCRRHNRFSNNINSLNEPTQAESVALQTITNSTRTSSKARALRFHVSVAHLT